MSWDLDDCVAKNPRHTIVAMTNIINGGNKKALYKFHISEYFSYL